jgi:hypothetical protein
VEERGREGEGETQRERETGVTAYKILLTRESQKKIV